MALLLLRSIRREVIARNHGRLFTSAYEYFDDLELQQVSRLRRRFSATSVPNARLGRTLYRQLLQWCRDAGDDIPLATYLPPVTTMPPYIDEEALKRLCDNKLPEISQLLPANSIIEENMLTVPLKRAREIADFFRAVYRMNINSNPSPEDHRERVSMSFEALKSLNELTGVLKDIRAQREMHLDRTGVKFCIGQVVQHKKDRWRGVIVGWERVTNSGTGEQRLSSLTTKTYDEPELAVANETEDGADSDNEIRYTLIMDSGDAHLLGGRKQTSDSMPGFPIAFQQDLELVKDVVLCRIRSQWTNNYFERLDATTKRFVPNEARQYEYPNDVPGKGDETLLMIEEQANNKRNALGADIVQGIQAFASRLKRRILDETSSAESRGLKVVTQFQHRLVRLGSGDVLTDQDRLTKPKIDDALLATLHLRWLLNVVLELAELLWQRQIAKHAIQGMRYRLGDVVLHKRYGFRGVVVAWDAKPTIDVSSWDGLQGIENPNEMPFYHVIPDQGDCIKAFGSERSFRYVCEDNLELCPRHKTVIDVDLDPDWDSDAREGRYVPPDDLRFKYGEDLADDNATELCCESLHREITQLHLLQRGISNDTDGEVQKLAELLSVDNLFQFLRLANNMDTASAVGEYIKELWKVHPDSSIRNRLDDGIADLLRGNKEKALIAFKELTVADPDYAEAWNKASTCYFMLGDMQASLEAAEKALHLIPRHYQALNGMGLIQYETRRYKMAAGTFRKSLTLDPFSPVSSRLAACFDLLHGLDLDDEQGAAEGTAPYE